MTAPRHFYFRIAATVNGVLVERECTDPTMQVWRERRNGGPWVTTVTMDEPSSVQPPKLPRLTRRATR